MKLTELYDSRRFAGNSGSYHYLAHGTTDGGEVYASIIAASPTHHFGLMRAATDIQPLGGGVWDCTVNYTPTGSDGAPLGDPTSTAPGQGGNPPSNPDGTPSGVADPANAPFPGAPSGPIGEQNPETMNGGPGGESGEGETQPIGGEYSFTTAGRTAKIERSLFTVLSRNAGGGTPPDHNRYINVTKNGVEGVDLQVPHLEFTITRPFEYITLQYVVTLAEMTGSVNLKKWRGFPPGTLLFLGADGSFKGGGGDGEDTWSVTFKFVYSRSEKFNGTNTVVDGIPFSDSDQFTKDGHDYLWVEYREEVDEDADIKTKVREPVAAHVERVYPRYDFRYLGIG